MKREGVILLEDSTQELGFWLFFRLLSDMRTIVADWQGKAPPVSEKVKSRKLSREENVMPPVVHNHRAAFPTAAQVSNTYSSLDLLYYS